MCNRSQRSMHRIARVPLRRLPIAIHDVFVCSACCCKWTCCCRGGDGEVRKGRTFLVREVRCCVWLCIPLHFRLLLQCWCLCGVIQRQRRPGADSICPERARSAGSRTALAPLQVPKNALQKRTKKAGSDHISSHLLRYQAWIWWSTTLLHDRWDGSRLEKKKSSDCLCQRVRADAVVFARLSFSEASLALSWEWECWNDMKVVTFRLAWGLGRLNFIMATALDKSTHFLAAFLFVATTKAWEKLKKCAEVETNYDSGKQTWRSSLAIDERQWWDLGLNSMWRMRWTSQRIVAAFLFVGETTKVWEKLRKLRQTKMEANCEAERNLTKKAFLLTNEVI